MANLITLFRIICCILLLFQPITSKMFIILYLLAGASDILDGFVARKTNTVSEFGSKLDSFADLIMVMICFYKLFPLIHLSKYQLSLMIMITMIKIVNMLISYYKKHQLLSEHTLLNKLTGLLLFIYPLIISIINDLYINIVIVIAIFAAIQETILLKKE